MDIEKLIEQLRSYTYWLGQDGPESHDIHPIICDEAATALSTLQAENSQLRAYLEYEREHANAYYEECGQWEAENEKLRAELKTCKEKNAGLALALLTECAPNPDCLGDDEWRAIRVELERVKAERDAAVEDVAAIIGDVEEIRRGYDVGNADADGAFAVLCETYCTNKGRSCYAECEKYHCKNFKWRGRKED